MELMHKLPLRSFLVENTSTLALDTRVHTRIEKPPENNDMTVDSMWSFTSFQILEKFVEELN